MVKNGALTDTAIQKAMPPAKNKALSLFDIMPPEAGHKHLMHSICIMNLRGVRGGGAR